MTKTLILIATISAACTCIKLYSNANFSFSYTMHMQSASIHTSIEEVRVVRLNHEFSIGITAYSMKYPVLNKPTIYNENKIKIKKQRKVSFKLISDYSNNNATLHLILLRDRKLYLSNFL